MRTRSLARSRRATTSLGALLLALTAACGTGPAPTDDSGTPTGDGARPDATTPPGCTSRVPDAGPLALACPAMLDLGCIPAAGAAFAPMVTATACSDPMPAVTCSPATVMPGETMARCEARTTSGEQAACAIVVRAQAQGAVRLSCASPITAACAGAATPVTVPPPRVEAPCGAPAGPPTSDAPAAGFPVGDTTVTFRAVGSTGETFTCTTPVTVTDSQAPTPNCPATASVVRDAPDAMVAPPPVTATDRCDPAPVVTAMPAMLAARGTAPVTYTAVDAAGQRASCTSMVQVLDAFPVTGVRVASARLTGTTTAVTIAWEPSAGADVNGYTLERATSPSGPWTAVTTTPSAALLANDNAVPGPRAYYRVVSWVGTQRGGASAPVAARTIAATSYNLRDQPVPGVPFATTLYGVVRHPADLTGGPYPLVVFLHGNHGICRRLPLTTDDACQTSNSGDCTTAGYVTTPNAEGYVYLAETLAAHGYVAVSISGNALNCRNDFIPERAALIIEHLRRWRGWAEGDVAPFGRTFVGAVDLARTGLVGHSRGGEAVALVPGRLAAAPERAITIGAVFSIAPTDVHNPQPGAVPYAVLVPACDGDVATLEGITTYDRTLDNAGDAAPATQVFMAGANHNFYSTEWRFDDNRLRLVCDAATLVGAAAQQGMLAPTLAAWLDSTLPAGAALEPFLRVDAPTPRGIVAHSGAMIDIRWSHAAGALAQVDDFEGAAAPATNRLDRPNTFSGFTAATLCARATCDTSWPHGKSAVILSWSGGTPRASWELAAGGFDARAHAVVSFRVASRAGSTLNSGRAEQDFVVRVVDAAGASAQIRVGEVTRVPHLYVSRSQRAVLQTVRVPLDALARATPALDRARLVRFELEMTAPTHPSGSVLVSDVEFAR